MLIKYLYVNYKMNNYNYYNRIIILIIIIIILLCYTNLEEHFTTKNVFDTYGTITDDGIKILINNLNIQKNDIFLDAGCGKGNVIKYFAENTPIKKLSGIEFIKDRYYESIKTLKTIKNYNSIKTIENKESNIEYNKQKNKNNNQIELKIVNGNMYDEENKNIFLDATIIFTCSTCFSDELLNHITFLCSKNKKLKYFISQKK